MATEKTSNLFTIQNQQNLQKEAKMRETSFSIVFRNQKAQWWPWEKDVLQLISKTEKKIKEYC